MYSIYYMHELQLYKLQFIMDDIISVINIKNI